MDKLNVKIYQKIPTFLKIIISVLFLQNLQFIQAMETDKPLVVKDEFIQTHNLIRAFEGVRSESWVRKLYRTMKEVYGARILTVRMVADYLGVSPDFIANKSGMKC